MKGKWKNDKDERETLRNKEGMYFGRGMNEEIKDGIEG